MTALCLRHVRRVDRLRRRRGDRVTPDRSGAA